jgi:hypothetical protein
MRKNFEIRSLFEYFQQLLEYRLCLNKMLGAYLRLASSCNMQASQSGLARKS